MNWDRIGQRVWAGVSSAVVSMGTGLAVLGAHDPPSWPSKVQWLLLGSCAAVGFVKGVNDVKAEPR